MVFDLDESHRAWREEVRAFVQSLPPDAGGHVHVASELKGPDSFLAQLRRIGWLGVGWPTKYGGMGKSAMHQWILLDELAYAGLPRIGDGVSMIGPTLIEVAGEDMKDEWLPKVLSGEVEFALGYSEPEAGTDLASLRTRAERDGDEFVINGQKTWNSSGHLATHEWLAVRTDPGAPARQGISILLVPLDSPGITVSEIRTWSGARTNDVYFDDVRVPARNLVGEVNRGWGYVMVALNVERFAIGGISDIQAMLDRSGPMFRAASIDGRSMADDPLVRQRIAALEIKLRVSRLLSMRNVLSIEHGQIEAHEASMVKVWATELRMEFGDVLTDIFGPWGQLDGSDPLAPLAGAFEQVYRDASHRRFTGGTNEIQRDMIARRALGLPRGSRSTGR